MHLLPQAFFYKKSDFFTAFWTLFLTDRVTLRWRNHSLRPFIANTGWGEDNAFTLYTIQLAIPRLLYKYIIQDFQATNESHRFSGKWQLGVWKIYIFQRKVRTCDRLQFIQGKKNRLKGLARASGWGDWCQEKVGRLSSFFSDGAYSRATLWTYHFVCRARVINWLQCETFWTRNQARGAIPWNSEPSLSPAS